MADSARSTGSTSEIELTEKQAALLASAGDATELSIPEWAVAAKLTRADVSKIAAGLVQKNLLSKVDDSQSYKLTETGIRVKSVLLGHWADAISSDQASLSLKLVPESTAPALQEIPDLESAIDEALKQ